MNTPTTPRRAILNTLKKIGGHLNVRKNLLIGLGIWLGVIVTYLILKFAFNLVDGIFKPIIPLIPFISGYPIGPSTIMVVILLYLTGLLSAFTFGKRIIEFGKQLFSRIPIVGTVYSWVHPAINALQPTLEGSEEQQTGKIVTISDSRFGGGGLKLIGLFMSPTLVEEIDTEGIVTNEEEHGVIYISTPPNPANGVLVLAPISTISDAETAFEENGELKEYAMTKEQYIAAILSLGAVFPRKVRLKRQQTPLID